MCESECKLFALLINGFSGRETKHYIYGITTLISHFTIPEIDIEITYGCGGISNSKTKEIVESVLTDARGERFNKLDSQYGRYTVADDESKEIEELFDNKVTITRTGYPGSEMSKGYGSYSVYKLHTKEAEPVQKAYMLLDKIHQYILSGKLETKILEFTREQEEKREEERRKDDEERKQNRETHRIKYEALVKRSKEFTIPAKKKDAIIVHKEDFEAICLTIKMVNCEQHYYSSSNRYYKIQSAFQNESMKIWIPGHVHCEGLTSKTHIVINIHS